MTIFTVSKMYASRSFFVETRQTSDLKPIARKARWQRSYNFAKKQAKKLQKCKLISHPAKKALAVLNSASRQPLWSVFAPFTVAFLRPCWHPVFDS